MLLSNMIFKHAQLRSEAADTALVSGRREGVNPRHVVRNFFLLKLVTLSSHICYSKPWHCSNIWLTYILTRFSFMRAHAIIITIPYRIQEFLGVFPPEGGVGLVPKRACLLTLAYYAFPRCYEFGERRWNDIDRENRRTRRKTCPSSTLSTTNPTWIDMGANPGLRGERPATNDLSHGLRPPQPIQSLSTDTIPRIRPNVTIITKDVFVTSFTMPTCILKQWTSSVVHSWVIFF
jgi:hypothetical protein